MATTYDAYSRVATVTYPNTNYRTKNVYDAYGHLYQVLNATTATESLLWQADAADAHARIKREIFGNGLVSERTFNHETGDLESIKTGTTAAPTSVQNLSYTFDAIDNLTSRTDALQTLTENFSYDGLNRLTQATGAVTKTYQYDAIGNITTKSDVGTYTYNASGPNSVRPHAVTSTAGTIGWSFTYDANGNMTSGGGRDLAYTSFNKPKQISTSSGTTTLTYDPNDNRILKTIASGTTVYVGGLYEKITAGSLITHKHYIHGGASLVAIYTSKSDGTSNTQYVHTDHLDSVAVITDANGAVVQRLSYDPHGRRRNVNGTDLSLSALQSFSAQTRKGFTRHTHDDEVMLINMNARLYDPITGRFITPDTIIPNPAGSQSYNRYSYVSNNPLSYTDPTGHSKLSRWYKKNKKKLKRAVMFAVGGPTTMAAGVNSPKIVEKLSGVNYVGGLLRTGALTNNLFGTLYGLQTGDWRSVARAQATAMVIAISAYAGNVTAGIYSSAVSVPTAGAGTYIVEGSLFVGRSALIGYESGYALARINGASSAEARAVGSRGASVSAAMAFLYMGYQGVTEGMTPTEKAEAPNTFGETRRPGDTRLQAGLAWKEEGSSFSEWVYKNVKFGQMSSGPHDWMMGNAGSGLRVASNPILAGFADIPLLGTVAYNFGAMPVAAAWTAGALVAETGATSALIAVDMNDSIIQSYGY